MGQRAAQRERVKKKCRQLERKPLIVRCLLRKLGILWRRIKQEEEEEIKGSSSFGCSSLTILSFNCIEIFFIPSDGCCLGRPKILQVFSLNFLLELDVLYEANVLQTILWPSDSIILSLICGSCLLIYVDDTERVI